MHLTWYRISLFWSLALLDLYFVIMETISSSGIVVCVTINLLLLAHKKKKSYYVVCDIVNIALVIDININLRSKSLQGELWGWTCFYVGVAAVAVGSSYYHLKPDDARLVWDRLPVSSFCSVEVIEAIPTAEYPFFLAHLNLSLLIPIPKLFIISDDCCFYIDHGNIHHWADWWEERNDLNYTPSFGWYNKHYVLEASPLPFFFVYTNSFAYPILLFEIQSLMKTVVFFIWIRHKTHCEFCKHIFHI